MSRREALEIRLNKKKIKHEQFIIFYIYLGAPSQDIHSKTSGSNWTKNGSNGHWIEEESNNWLASVQNSPFLVQNVPNLVKFWLDFYSAPIWSESVLIWTGRECMMVRMNFSFQADGNTNYQCWFFSSKDDTPANAWNVSLSLSFSFYVMLEECLGSLDLTLPRRFAPWPHDDPLPQIWDMVLKISVHCFTAFLFYLFQTLIPCPNQLFKYNK